MAVSLRRAAWAATVLLAAGVATGCAGGPGDLTGPTDGGDVVPALAALPGGGLLTGDLDSGIVRSYADPGSRDLGDGEVVARLDVATRGERGLLGLATAGEDRAWAAYVEEGEDGRLVVERLAPGPRERVWTGPVASPRAAGGRIRYDPEGDRLLVAIGDAGEPGRDDGRGRLDGTLVAIDPDGPEDQTPVVLSRGWHDPSAYARTEGGVVWVADDAPGRSPGRIARGDVGGGTPDEATELSEATAPAGVVALGEDELAVCGVGSGRLARFRRADSGRWYAVGALDDDCRHGVERLADGRLAVAGATGVHVVGVPPAG